MKVIDKKEFCDNILNACKNADDSILRTMERAVFAIKECMVMEYEGEDVTFALMGEHVYRIHNKTVTNEVLKMLSCAKEIKDEEVDYKNKEFVYELRKDDARIFSTK